MPSSDLPPSGLPPTGTVGWTAPPAPPTTKPRSRLGLLTLSAVVLVLGGFALAAGVGADGITASLVIGSALLVTALGLLLGSRWGRSRWLIALAVVLAVMLGGANSLETSYGTAAGDPTWRVQGSASYRLALGEPVLDLRALDTSGVAGPTVVQVSLGAGSLTVLVPEDLQVSVVTDLGLGELRLVDEVSGTRTSQEGSGVTRTDSVGDGGQQDVRLEIRAGVAEVEVRRVAGA